MPKGYHNNHIRGHKHYQWNNNRIISSHGYARIRVGVGHPLADPNGYAYEHLLVVLTTNSPEANLIRQCPSKHLIHHINGDKTDNRIENLQVMERAVHNAFHNAEKKGRKPLTTEDAIEIRKRRLSGEELKPIATDYGISVQTVSKIAKGERWKAAGRLLVDREWKEFPEPE